MNTISFNSIDYNFADDVIKNAPIFCKGIRNGREFIKKKTLDTDVYLYIKLDKNNIWTISEGKSVKFDKVIIKKEYVNNIKELDDNNTVADNGIEKAPMVIELKDNEKFKDDEGNILEIETRGERKCNKIYFKVKDVSEGFGMINIYTTLIHENKGYEKNIHYKYFNCYTLTTAKNTTSKKPSVTKELFLTYEGMLRVLFVSKNGKTSKFISWATKTLFTVQMGTNKQKTKLGASILGTDVNTIIEIFNKNTNAVPCTYFVTFGFAKDLRHSMNISDDINDDCIIGKYGRSNNISRRLGEHNDMYGRINGVNIRLLHYSYIDPQYTSQAEKDISNCFKALNAELKYKNHEELIFIPQDKMKIVESQFELVGKKYMGHVSEFITKLKEMENEMEKKQIQHNADIKRISYEKDKIIYEKDLKLKEYENELLKKELEVMKLKMKN
jgi:hypothetical protein